MHLLVKQLFIKFPYLSNHNFFLILMSMAENLITEIVFAYKKAS